MPLSLLDEKIERWAIWTRSPGFYARVGSEFRGTGSGNMGDIADSEESIERVLVAMSAESELGLLKAKCFRAKYVHDKSPRDIADSLGIGRATVFRYIKSVKESIAKALWG